MDSLLHVQLCIFFTILFSQGVAVEGLEKCHLAKTCGDCMRIDPRCSWCKDRSVDNETSEGVRCDTKENLRDIGCDDNEITSKQSNLTILEEREVQDPKYVDEDLIEEAVPISPQVVQLALRIGDTETIKVRVRQVEDYPVDLYYLMDLSNSMKDDLASLKGLGGLLADTMRNITRSFALGFGSFVDKPVSPYISALDELKGRDSCSGNCERAYSFKNQLPLNQNTSLFNEKVSSTRISGNEDEAEGTLDAIVQATVCAEIGWRNESRRLLLITSDAPFHIEGDGKMAGIMRPYDGKCHLDEDSYKTSHLFDYPSIGQLNEILVKHNIISIFAISGEQKLYQELAEIIEGAQFAQLSTRSDNIVEIVEEKYKEITGSIKITHSQPEGLELTFRSNCTKNINSAYALECEDIHDGQQIVFEVDVTATRCTNNTFEISPIGFDKRLTVQVSVICNCSCEFAPDVNSTYCAEVGSDVCGICQCPSGRYGETCECTGESQEEQNQGSKDKFCKPDNKTNVLCSGRGECICGECRCHESAEQGEIISGIYCECNNQACPLEDGEVCGGSERGECICGIDQRTNECQCRPGYTGETCSCPTQTDTCRASNGRICNDQGTCECGKCTCLNGSKYSGPQCDECLTCTECDFYINCVECLLNKTNEDCEACSQQVSIVNVTELPTKLENTSSCTFTDSSDNCSISFLYLNFEENQTIYVKGGKDCPLSDKRQIGLELPLLILYIVLGIILIGLILIFIYRFYTWYMDRKEYQQFLAEKENAQWDKNVNPIYTSGTRKYVNPMYGK